MDKLKMHSANKVNENVAKVGKLFPNCVTERMNENGEVEYAIDFDMLKQELSSVVVEGNEERYQFTWPDKKKSILLANAPIAKTLRPCRGESVDFDTTENLYIEGDNLDVLKLLQETYLGKIKMIYIDPPYNTGNDFVYNDDFAESAEEYLANSGQFDSEGNRLVANTESNGRFHTDWLNMIYTRIKVSKDLLAEDGVILISLDDNEQSNLKKVCDEIYGENNFVGTLIHQRAKGGGQAKYIVKGHDYILVYAKNIQNISLTRKKVVQQKTYEINGELYIKNDDVIRKQFGKYDKSLGDRRCFYEQLVQYKGEDKKKEIDALIEKGELFLELNSEGMHTICRYEKLQDATSKLYSIIKVLSEEGKKELDDLGIVGFSYPKPVEIIKQLVEAGSNKQDSIVLDFFSGSATTAHAVMQLNAEDGGNRKFIMVQLPEETDSKSEAYKAGYKTICEIGKERIRRAGQAIIRDKRSVTGGSTKYENMPACGLDIGFRVLKLDSTNMKDVYYSPADYEMSMFDTLADNIKEDRTPEDLLFQVMLDLGVLLSSKIEESTIAGKKVFNVADGFLMACFDENVSDETITAIAKQKPYYFVMRDSSMASDSVATNFDQIFATYSPDTVRKVL